MLNRKTEPIDMFQVVLGIIPAALAAGEAILDIYQEADYGIEFKSDNTPVTRADKAAHRIICEALAATPWPVISEEGADTPYAVRKDWNTFWLVDPLDGTKEFIRRNGEFTVNIGLIHHDYPLGGIVYAPFTGELFLGFAGSGAWKLDDASAMGNPPWLDGSWELSGRRLPFSPTHRPFTVVASRSHMNLETQEFIEGLRLCHPDLSVSNRGSSLKTCLVAEGAADVYPRFGPTMEWDTAAAQAVAEAAGKKVVEASTGLRLIYNKENLLNPGFIAFDRQKADQLLWPGRPQNDPLHHS